MIQFSAAAARNKQLLGKVFKVEGSLDSEFVIAVEPKSGASGANTYTLGNIHDIGEDEDGETYEGWTEERQDFPD